VTVWVCSTAHVGRPGRTHALVGCNSDERAALHHVLVKSLTSPPGQRIVVPSRCEHHGLLHLGRLMPECCSCRISTNRSLRVADDLRTIYVYRIRYRRRVVAGRLHPGRSRHPALMLSRTAWAGRGASGSRRCQQIAQMTTDSTRQRIRCSPSSRTIKPARGQRRQRRRRLRARERRGSAACPRRRC